MTFGGGFELALDDALAAESAAVRAPAPTICAGKTTVFGDAVVTPGSPDSAREAALSDGIGEFGFGSLRKSRSKIPPTSVTADAAPAIQMDLRLIEMVLRDGGGRGLVTGSAVIAIALCAGEILDGASPIGPPGADDPRAN